MTSQAHKNNYDQQPEKIQLKLLERKKATVLFLKMD